MKAVVTGATSMMGCSLIRSLIDNGTDRIFAVVHPDSHNLAKISYDKRIAFIECDCQEHDHLPELINEECDVFYHFAWIPSHLVGRERYFDLGVDYETALLRGNLYVEKDIFLYLLEFLANMTMLIENEKTNELLKRTVAILENIPKILEKMNYKLEKLEDKVIIVKRNSDVDSILDKVPEDISMLLLEYNDFRICNDLKAKAKILKAIDLYLDNDNKKLKKQIKGLDSTLVDSFETILNNMGINHQNNSDIYKSMSDKEKNQWYDKCFLLMIHGIRAIKINDIKKEREYLSKNG